MMKAGRIVAGKYIEALPGEQQFELLKRMLIYTTRWGTILEERLGVLEEPEVFFKMQARLYQEMGMREAKGLRKMGLVTGNGIDAVERALL